MRDIPPQSPPIYHQCNGRCTELLQEAGGKVIRECEAWHEKLSVHSLSPPAGERKGVGGGEPATWRLLSTWCMWSTLGVIILKILIVPLLINFFPVKPHKRDSLFTLSSTSISQSFWEESPTVSQDLDRECAQQSKQETALTHHLCSSSSPEEQRAERFWSARVPISFPVHAFLPRKLPPPSTVDDSFPSYL